MVSLREYHLEDNFKLGICLLVGFLPIGECVICNLLTSRDHPYVYKRPNICKRFCLVDQSISPSSTKLQSEL